MAAQRDADAYVRARHGDIVGLAEIASRKHLQHQMGDAMQLRPVSIKARPVDADAFDMERSRRETAFAL